jgi:transketolase
MGQQDTETPGASGSEVGLIVAAAERLRKEGIAVRCVSMPSRDLFDALPEADRDAVFPPSIRAPLAVGAGSTLGWHRYVGAVGDVIGVDRFGASAPGGVVMRKYGFSIDNVCPRAKALLDQRRAATS